MQCNILFFIDYYFNKRAFSVNSYISCRIKINYKLFYRICRKIIYFEAVWHVHLHRRKQPDDQRGRGAALASGPGALGDWGRLSQIIVDVGLDVADNPGPRV